MNATSAKRVTIVGAGFSGLTSAYYLNRAGFDVEIFESSDRAGGLIQTIITPEGLVETAANAVLNSSLVEEMASTLGLTFLRTKRQARKRFIWAGGRARRWPLGLPGTLSLLKGVSLFALNRKKAKPAAGETVAAWVERVFGLEAARFLIEAALQGIYAGDPTKLSASLIFHRFFASAKKMRVKKVRRGSVAPEGGMGAWMTALESHLLSRGVKIHYKKAFPALASTDPDHPVVIATGAKQAALLLENLDSEKAMALRSIEMLPLMTTTAFFQTTDEKTQGFGVLFPPYEKRQMLGVLKNDLIFKNRTTGLHSETWIAGGALQKNVCEKSDSEIVDMIRSERKAVFGLSEVPVAEKITRWPEALPHYTTELERHLPLLNRPVKNVILVGNYLGEIGLSKLLERASQMPFELATQIPEGTR